jgi:hypothetical protein
MKNDINFLEANDLNRNNLRFEQDNPDLQTDSQADKLAVIAGAITTFGDALATMAALLAIEEARQEKNDGGDNKSMQKQIDYLTSEMEQLKRQMKKLTPLRR